MKSYHRLMHTTCLCLSAMMFKWASSLLGSAVHHKAELSIITRRERNRIIGVHTPLSGAGVHFFDEITPDEDEYLVAARAVNQAVLASPTRWTESDPMSDFDPIHPDYVDRYPEK